jgi:enoyl-CoA hydratase
MTTIAWNEIEPGIVLLTLDRPERLNAINDQWIDDFHAALDRLERERRLRVVILTGAGRAFCAGADLKQEGPILADSGAARTYGGLRGQERLAAVVQRLCRLPQPVIAAVNGAAAGGGFALTLAADIRIASSSAHFHVANARIGLSAGECGISWLFPRLVGLSRCFELMLTGRRFDAPEALAIGLLSQVVAPEALLDSALELARSIAANAALGVWMTKEVVYGNLGATDFDAAVRLENRTQVLCALSGDVDEAAQAFREQRAPEFYQPR